MGVRIPEAHTGLCVAVFCSGTCINKGVGLFALWKFMSSCSLLRLKECSYSVL